MDNVTQKINHFTFFFCFFYFLITPSIRAQQSDDDILELFNAGYDTLALAKAGEQTEQLPPLEITRGTKEETVGLLTGFTLRLQDLLTEKFYLNTYPLRHKPIIDEAAFTYMPTRSYNFDKTLRWNWFFRLINKDVFNKKNSGIKSYLGIAEQTLIRKLDDPSLTEYNIPKVISLFENIKIQERNIGLILQGAKHTNRWTLHWTVPFYYMERNFYLTEEEIKKIENEHLFDEANNDYMEFARNHLVSDKIGIGDTRIDIEWNMYKRSCLLINLGAQGTVPTAMSFKKGIYGSYFPFDRKDPVFDLHKDLIDPYRENNTAQVKQAAINFFSATLDRMSTILLERPLGNSQHPSFGIYVASISSFTDHLKLSSKISTEITIPFHEKRFFIRKIDEDELLGRNWDDTDIEESLKLLNDRFVEKFFPTMYTTTVFPGFIFKTTSKFTYQGDIWNLSVGSDFWIQTKENLLNIHAPASKLDTLNIDAAKRSYGYISSLWLSIARTPSSSPWHVVFQGHATPWNYGVGASMGVVFSLQTNF